MLIPQLVQAALAALIPLSLPLSRNATGKTDVGTSPDYAHTTGNERLLNGTTMKLIQSYFDGVGAKGGSLSIVASPSFTGKGWAEDVYSFGLADHMGKPVTPDSMFAIASNSKLFTYLAVGNMILNGTILPNGEPLSFETKVKDILPTWELMDPYASDHVNVQDLLSMRSGMPRHDNATPRQNIPAADVLAQMRYLKPSAEIRHAWQYNNLHFMALSEMVPQLTGVPFAEYVQRHIFDPVGLQDATYSSTRARATGHLTEGHIQRRANLVACAEQVKGGGALDTACLGPTESIGWYMDHDVAFNNGAGGIILSGRDMARWVKELLEPKALSNYLLDERHQGQGGVASTAKYPELSDNVYGLAQETFSYRGERIITHGGDVPGQMSVLMVLPDREIGLFWAQNTESAATGTLTQTVPFAAIDALLGLEPIDWDGRLKKQVLGQVSPVHLPKTIAGDASKIEGVYTDKGYGTLRLHMYREGANAHGDDSLLPLVAEIVRSQVPQKINTSQLFIAKTMKTFQTHLVITPWSGERYANWSGINTYCPMIGGQTRCIGEIMGQGRALITDEGIGLFDFWGSGSAVPSKSVNENTRPEDAEVWFCRA